MKYAIYSLFMACAISITACGNNIAELEQYAEQVKNNPRGVVAGIPEPIIYATFSYPQANKDPFDPNVISAIFDNNDIAISVPPKDMIAIDQHRSREFLEGFPLDSLSMVGTLQQDGQLWALIQTTDGTVQKVTTGNYVGMNSGEIKVITGNDIALTEKVRDGIGGVIERFAMIRIAEKV